MRSHLSADDVARILRLDREGQKPTKIAAQIGCHRNTVHTVLRGAHPLHRRPAESEDNSDHELDGHDYVTGIGFQLRGGPVRCDGCQGLISQLPCVLCAALSDATDRF